MRDILDLLNFIIYLAIPALAGLALTALVGRVALDLWRRHMLTQEDLVERKLENPRRGLNVDLVQVDAHPATCPGTCWKIRRCLRGSSHC